MQQQQQQQHQKQQRQQGSYNSYNSSVSSQGPLTQNAYSSQGSMSLALSQSDRLRMMASSANSASIMSQDSSIAYLEDYKSQGDDTILSQDYEIRSQTGYHSQNFTQY